MAVTDMPNAKEIKSRIKSVKDTRKITNAMYLIASTKLQRAKGDLDRTRPFFEVVRDGIKRIFRTAADLESPYFYPPGVDGPLDGTYGCLVITADKGLAGAYNKNVLKETEKLLEQHPDTRLFVVGDYGRHFFQQRGFTFEPDFLYTAQSPTLDRARSISSKLLDLYDSGALSEIYLIYTDMKSSLSYEARSARLLPFHRASFSTAPGESGQPDQEPRFEFVPSIEAVLDREIYSYTAGFIYSALIDSFCAEQNARMMAMDAANRNAEKLLSELSLQYNRVRQAAITQEITEISSGARAQPRKEVGQV